eukprot:UN01104
MTNKNTKESLVISFFSHPFQTPFIQMTRDGFATEKGGCFTSFWRHLNKVEMHDIFNLCYRIDSYAIFKKPIPFQIFQSNPATKLKCINAFSYLTGSIDKFNCIQNDVYSLFVKCNNRNLLTIQSYELFQWILHNIFGVNTYDQLDPEEDEDEEEEEEEEEVEQNCLRWLIKATKV